LEDLNKYYLGGIERAIAAEKSAGRLDGILALVAEQRAVADAAAAKAAGSQSASSRSAVPQSDDETTPSGLKALRTTYRAQFAKLVADRAASLKTLTDPLEKRLAMLETELTKANRVPDAKAVRAYREALAELGGGNSLEVTEVTREGGTNSLGMKFVSVPGTNVLFCIHETRRQDYDAYANQAPGVDSSWMNQQRNGTPCGHEDNHPVVGVSWEDAQAFCEWLSKKEGKTYRLPTDEEWSIAVGLGEKENHGIGVTPEMLDCKETNEFPWRGNFPPQSNDMPGNYGDTAWVERFPDARASYMVDFTDGWPTTAPVKSFKPNQIGIYDMGGNVWEWVENSWSSTQQEHRALRGASFGSADRARLLSSDRNYAPQSVRYDDFGFRVVLVPTKPNVASNPLLPTAQPQQAPVASTTLQAPQRNGFTNSLGMKFVPVKGTNVMFCIHETRYKDYASYASDAQGVNNSWKSAGIAEDHPVTMVSWEDAQKFCAWLSAKEGKTYRLPTDKEWSIAVGIGRHEKWEQGDTPATIFKEQSEFPWGDQWPPPKNRGNYAGAAEPNRQNDEYAATAPVMTFKQNSKGLYDMGGNVWEWVEDYWNDTRQERVLRGASFTNADVENLRASFRLRQAQGQRSESFGFRCTVELK
jgi:formylglycine-generating enzyme required for sulfatase activity